MALHDLQWITVYNDSGEEVPAFALMRMSGIDTEGVLKVAKPNAAGQTDLLVNAPIPIPVGKYGQAHRNSPCAVLYDTGDGTPAAGEAWGAESGSWKANKNKAGAKIIGGPVGGVVSVSHLFGGPFSTATEFSGARVYDNTARSDATGNLSLTMTGTNERWDAGNYWDAGSPTVFTIPSDGYYEVGTSQSFTSTTGSSDNVHLFVRINKNGTAIARFEWHWTLTAGVVSPAFCVSPSTYYNFVAGDTVGVTGTFFNDSAADETFTRIAGTAADPWKADMWIRRLTSEDRVTVNNVDGGTY